MRYAQVVGATVSVLCWAWGQKKVVLAVWLLLLYVVYRTGQKWKSHLDCLIGANACKWKEEHCCSSMLARGKLMKSISWGARKAEELEKRLRLVGCITSQVLMECRSISCPSSSSSFPLGRDWTLNWGFKDFQDFLFCFACGSQGFALPVTVSFPTSIWFWQLPRRCKGLLCHGQMNQEIFAAFGACARCSAAFLRKQEGNNSRWSTFPHLLCYEESLERWDRKILPSARPLASFGVQPCLSFLGRSLGLIICCVWVSFQVCLRQAVFCLWEVIRKVLGSASGLSLYSREGNPLFFCLNYICLFKFLVVNIIPQWKGLFFSPVKPHYQLLVCPIKLISIYNKNRTRYISVLVHTSLLWQLLPSKANDLMSSGEVRLQWYCICINLFLIHFTVQK